MKLEEFSPEAVGAIGRAIAYQKTQEVLRKAPIELLEMGVCLYESGKSSASEIAYQAAKGLL